MKNFEYTLIDCGQKKKWERFGDFVVQRPCPQAQNKSDFGSPVDAAFIRTKERNIWKNNTIPASWIITVGDVKAELRLSPQGQIGIFPEQWDTWQWIQNIVRQHAHRPLKILNLFAYTGMATLHAAAPHTEVCHVDGSKAAIEWAKRNAELSKLSDAKIRWICDDVTKFVTREIKRKNTYDGIILDPPAFGRGGKNIWKIERDLPKLLDQIAKVLSNDPVFVVLTCHAPKHFCPQKIGTMLQRLPGFKQEKAEHIRLLLKNSNGHHFLSSFGARITVPNDKHTRSS